MNNLIENDFHWQHYSRTSKCQSFSLRVVKLALHQAIHHFPLCHEFPVCIDFSEAENLRNDGSLRISPPPLLRRRKIKTPDAVSTGKETRITDNYQKYICAFGKNRFRSLQLL
ncbi:hypothetical protein [Noviherbaspirillum cavernae]|uniref:hypothetical protein n=1 Tax=Noviherbaspirillum cavernae TaxID=2320862 RepID=UPI0011C40839|nr:hypothetical protein [Noviherbaspirillum cavernae]